MSGQRQDGLPIAEAATVLRLSPEAVRKRLNRGTLDGYKRDGAWFVVLSPEAERPDVASGRQDATTDNGRTAGRPEAVEPIETTYTTMPADVERAIERTGAKYLADFTALYDRIGAEVSQLYEAQIAAKDEALAAKDQTIATQADTLAELRQRLAALEAEKQAQAASAAPSVAEVETTPISARAPEQPAGGLWGWVRRVFGGV